jgi:hypothetical protein
MTTTRLGLALGALLLGLACNPLDPSKIEVDRDSGTTTTGCTPACTATQYCLKDQSGVCGCYERCDDSQCQAGSCAIDPTQGGVCIDLAQTRCP